MQKIQHDEKAEVLNVCAECNEPLSRTALTDIVYGYVACECDVWKFSHLVKVAWHKACYAKTKLRQV